DRSRSPDTQQQDHSQPSRSALERGVGCRQGARDIALYVSILNLSRKLRVGLAAEVSYCRIMCTHGGSYLFLVPCIFLFSIDNYSLVILAAESCTSTLASNSCHSSQRNTRGANVGTLTVEGAVTE